MFGTLMLSGRVILVVEDEALIAMDIESILEAAGCIVLGPSPSVADALTQLGQVRPDCALLDVNIGNEKVFPVADALADANIPFILMTGCSRDGLPARHRDRPLQPKPYLEVPLLQQIEQIIEDHRNRGATKTVSTAPIP